MAKQNILMVDDQPGNLVALEALLGSPERNLISAKNGNDALSLLLKHDFSLVLLDVQMPGMDGFEVAELMRTNKKSRSIPIIFLTAINKEQKFVFKGYDSGAVDYLFKPIEPMILKSKVQFFLELDQKTRELEDTLVEVSRLKEYNQLLLESVGEGILSLDMDGKVTFVNPAAARLLHVEPESLIGDSIENIIFVSAGGAKKLHWSESNMYQHCCKGEKYQDEDEVYCKRDRKLFPISYTASPIRSKTQVCSGVVVMFQDITTRKEHERQLIYLSQYDGLTGLPNRYLFEHRLRQAVERADLEGHSAALLYLDLDLFKEVNDTHGHAAGDLLLKSVADRLRNCVRQVDTVCRLSGDEFTVILEGINKAEDVAKLAEKICKSLGATFDLKDRHMLLDVHIGVSIGIALYPDVAENVDSLLRCADEAMYLAKSNGRSTYAYYQSGQDLAANR